ncbi:MAG: MarR family transcriptional regulator [Gordonia sp. (in: high G+C Gram-positive bacteria)]
MPSTPSPLRPAIPTPADAAETLSLFLERLHCVAQETAMEALAASDLTFTQHRALFVICTNDGPLPVHEIAKAVGLSFAAAGRAVDRLVQAGLVDRREDHADRRIKRVTPTPQGRAVIEKQLDIKEELVARFVSGLPTELRTALTYALDSIVDADINYFDPDHFDPDPTPTEPKDPS